MGTDDYEGYDRAHGKNAFGKHLVHNHRMVLKKTSITAPASGAGKGPVLLAEEKRQLVSAKTTSDQWAVVQDKCDLFTIGQVVGNGYTIKFTPELQENVEVCLSVRPEIPQDTTLYPFKDFAEAEENGAVGQPMHVDVTQADDKAPFCAKVNRSGTFFPILRRDYQEGNYTLYFGSFLLFFLLFCVASFCIKKKGSKVERPRDKACAKCTSCWFLSAGIVCFIMVSVLVPA